jgi:hypothetical protein
MYVCMYVCKHAFNIFISLSASIHVYLQIIYTYIYIYTHTYTYMFGRCFQLQELPLLHTHTHTHTHTHIYIYTCLADAFNFKNCLYFVRNDRADCVWVGRRRSRPKGKTRFEPFENCVFRVAQTWLSGIFPSPREFCGQLKRNQLYRGM